MKILNLKLLDNIFGVAQEGVKLGVTRAKFVRFAKICLYALSITFIGFALLISIKYGNKEIINTFLDAILRIVESA